MNAQSLAVPERRRERRAAHRHLRRIIPWRALSLPATVLVFWAVAAKGFDAYLRYPWLDVPTHFAGGIAGVCSVDALLLRLRPWTGQVHAAVRIGLAFGLLACATIGWEFLEFLSDYFLQSHLNLGVTDTLSDLFFGLAGGSWGVVVRHLLARRRRTCITHRQNAVNAIARSSEGTYGPNRPASGRAKSAS